MLAQFLGAFAGAALVYGVYFEALHEVEDKFYDGERLVNATAGIFATYPQPHLSIGGGFVDQVPLPSGSLRHPLTSLFKVHAGCVGNVSL